MEVAGDGVTVTVNTGALIIEVGGENGRWPVQRAGAGLGLPNTTPVANLWSVGDGVYEWTGAGQSGCVQTAPLTNTVWRWNGVREARPGGAHAVRRAVGARDRNTLRMNRFSATNTSESVVAAGRSEIWSVLTDPVLLPKLTPLLTRIDADGDLWRWHLIRLSVLGVGVGSRFTERMRFQEGRRIDYAHEPPPGSVERTGAEGWYVLSDVDGGTHLAIGLTLTVELPLSRAAKPVVTRVMEATMRRTGDRFATNLLNHLGVAPTVG